MEVLFRICLKIIKPILILLPDVCSKFKISARFNNIKNFPGVAVYASHTEIQKLIMTLLCCIKKCRKKTINIDNYKS